MKTQWGRFGLAVSIAILFTLLTTIVRALGVGVDGWEGFILLFMLFISLGLWIVWGGEP